MGSEKPPVKKKSSVDVRKMKQPTEAQITRGKTIFGAGADAEKRAHNAAVDKAKKAGVKGDKKLYSIGMDAGKAAKKKAVAAAKKKSY